MNTESAAKTMLETPAAMTNIIVLDLAGYRDGDKSLGLAMPQARSVAQNLIDRVEDHRHLRAAKILLLFETGKKSDPDGLIQLGKAFKASDRTRLLTGGPDGREAQADFEIRLNADLWPDLEAIAKCGVVDHELSHCAATIAGRYTPEAKLGGLVAGLGSDHIETHYDARDESGRILVRYIKRKGDIKPGDNGYSDQPIAWRTRRHPVEEFPTVVSRWGAWYASLQALVDVWDPADDHQLDLLGQAADDTLPVDEALETIRTARKPAALDALVTYTDIDALRRIEREGLRGDWRRAAVARRIAELKAAA